MEDLDNNEMEPAKGTYDLPKPKRKRVDPQPVTKAKLTKVDLVKMFYKRCNGNINCVASGVGIPKHVVEQIIRDENI